MTRIEVDLPEDLRRRAEARAAETGHAALAEYIRSLVEEDTAEEIDYGAPPHLTFRTKEELETLLVEGLDSGPPIEVTSRFWEDLRRRIGKRRADSR